MQIMISLPYAFMFGYTYWYKDEPRVRNRSPLLLLVIIFGAWIDTHCKTYLFIKSPV